MNLNPSPSYLTNLAKFLAFLKQESVMHFEPVDNHNNAKVSVNLSPREANLVLAALNLGERSVDWAVGRTAADNASVVTFYEL